MNQLFLDAKQASRTLLAYSDEQLSAALRAVADAIEQHIPSLLEANALDVQAMDAADPLRDRLLLTPGRLKDIAHDMRHVAGLPTPLGILSEQRTLSNGLRLRRVSVPFGVIGVIYEARPNVTFDVFSLCLKSGNACLLKGSRSAEHSNRAAVALIHEVLQTLGFNPAVCTLLPATHEATGML